MLDLTATKRAAPGAQHAVAFAEIRLELRDRRVAHRHCRRADRLAVGQWSSERQNRADEILIIERLASDLESDLGSLQAEIDILLKKEESLKRILDVLASTDSKPADGAEFLGDMIAGANYGWNQSVARRITFDELLGSGRFGLIRSPALRERIAEYYSFDEDAHNRIEERETEFPAISYRLVRRGSEFELDPALTKPELERMTARALQFPLLDHVVAELNFSRFVRAISADLIMERNELAGEISAYLDTIR